MSLREKVGQMFVVGYPGRTVTATAREMIDVHGVGGFFFQPGTNYLFPEELAELVGEVKAAADESPTGISLFLACDNEGGPATILHPAFGGTPTPGNLALGASGREADTYASYAALGADMRACGLNLNLAPAIDVLGSTANPDYTVRSFGSRPDVNARLGAAAIRGLQDAGVMATAKHFPGLAFFDEDTHRSAPHLAFSADRLRDPDLLQHFRAVIDADTAMIMTCHAYVDAWDHVYPVTMSQKILTGVLREQLGYQGLIMTDSLGMGGINQDFEWDTVAVQAVAAGCDILLMVSRNPEDLENRIEALMAATEDGRLSVARIDEAVRRILETKAAWNVGQRGASPSPSMLWSLPGREERVMQNYEAAVNGVVVVRNKDGLIPLSSEVTKVVVICPPALITRAGKGVEQMPLGETLGHYIRQHLPDAQEIRLDTVPTRAQRALALKAVSGAEVAIVGVLLAEQSPAQQDFVRQVLDSGVPSLLIGLGLPSDLALFSDAGNFVAANGPSAINCRAVSDVLFGVRRPGGTLPVSIGTLFPAGHALSLP
jgi:beta-N-acetylhexosaminidase